MFEILQGLKELAVKCLCDLVIEHSHFNYREDIFSVIVDFMDSKVEKVGRHALYKRTNFWI